MDGAEGADRAPAAVGYYFDKERSRREFLKTSVAFALPEALRAARHLLGRGD